MPRLQAVIEVKHGNYLINRAGYRQAPAHDRAEPCNHVLAAAQMRMSIAAFEERANSASWRPKPSWHVVSTKDQIVASDLQEWMDNRIDAHVVRILSGHASILSQPATVAATIEDAAKYQAVHNAAR
jgi:pimeloyl-ACP methyl ester carboxylesterase